ncbi:hypothetical protein [Sphingobium cloacae]|uniref:Fe2OG dioxygenase domain-containing protein n=1 Tax=Sphingobium cloacae TaxID=120107 RepID=A0A1E1F528_9SPHN|nr:hypothetical protein [Sphingobium cloacae]BAV65623.1 hypothetical protein SCLO_1025830 [Sphingobium cloacae]
MKHFRLKASRSTPAIARIDASELSPGSLGQYFHDGASAAVITGNEWITTLWRSLTAQDSAMPWTASLYDLAGNLRAHDHVTEALGDVYYFKPRRHSYIGRKIEIRSDHGMLSSTPASFRTRQGSWQISDLLREQCWRFSMAVMKALAPARAREAQFDGVRAVVQHLRYHDTMDGHNSLYVMVHNSLGAWGRIGYGLDRRREELRGPLGRRGVSDALALLSLAPPLRAAIDRLNSLAGHFDKRGMVPDGYSLLSKEHVDTRYFSALCGSRRNLRTDIFVDGAWLPLPVNSTDIVVIPGARAMLAYGIQPTLHRVLQADGEHGEGEDGDAANITLLLGAK